MLNNSLSVILPAYNDELTIKKVVGNLIRDIKPRVAELEIVIVEDGSKDNTLRACNELKDAYPEVNLVSHQINEGYGQTLRDGFSAASKELIFYTDGDDQYNIAEITPALSELSRQGADAVLGYRWLRKDGIIRNLISRIYNIIVFLLLGVKARDVNCSFKLIKKTVLDTLNLTSRSAFIDAELVYELNKRKARIIELPVTNYPNKYRRSHFINPRLTMDMLNELFKKKRN